MVSQLSQTEQKDMTSNSTISERAKWGASCLLPESNSFTDEDCSDTIRSARHSVTHGAQVIHRGRHIFSCRRRFEQAGQQEVVSFGLLSAAVKDRTKEERTAEDETWPAAFPSTYIPACMDNPPRIPDYKLTGLKPDDGWYSKTWIYWTELFEIFVFQRD